MPLVLHPRGGRKLAVMTAMMTALSGAVATAPASADPAQCSSPTLSQPFLQWGDNNWYAPSDIATWTLTGGAQLQSATLIDGSAGTVVDMPPGSTATSPPFCVQQNYPTAKAMIRDASGPPNLSFYVTYSTGQTQSSGAPSPPGSWQLSPPLSLYPSSRPGWNVATFTFVAGSKPSDVQVYDFWVDPHRSG